MSYPEGPSTQHLRTLVPKTSKGMVVGTRVLKSWVLGPSGLTSGTFGFCLDPPKYVKSWPKTNQNCLQGQYSTYCWSAGEVPKTAPLPQGRAWLMALGCNQVARQRSLEPAKVWSRRGRSSLCQLRLLYKEFSVPSRASIDPQSPF